MENEIESSALPPVSSLRSRFEALSRGGSNVRSNTSEETGNKQGSKFGIIGRGARNNSRPTTPSVVVSPAASTDAPQAPLRRVVSSPSQPTSPEPSAESFASKQHFFSKVHSSSSDKVGSGTDGDEDFETPSSATPRKTPSTPNFSVALTSVNRNSFSSDLGVGAPSVGNTPKTSARPPSVSSLSERNSAEDLGVKEKTAKSNTDVEDLPRKLSRKPPPPPPGKKGPPPPPLRSTDSRSTTPSSRSETPSLETDTVPQPYSASLPNHFRSDSTSSASSFSLAPPPLPFRSTPSPNLPPRPTGLSSKVSSPNVPLKSPPLPPRSTEGILSGNTIIYHSQDKGFKTLSAERLATPASEGSEQSQLSITPPKLPSRTGNNSAFSSPVVATGPPLPPRLQPTVSEGTTQASAVSQAPRLPPRSNGVSAPGSLGDPATKADDLSTAIRRLPPPIPGQRSSSAASSRESLVSVDDATSTTLSASTLVEPPLLPPPTRTVPASAELSHSGSIHHSKEHKHHHFPHLPRQINSLPITKILAAVKLGSSESHGGHGSRSPHAQQSGGIPEVSSEVPVERSGTAGLLPPPTRTVGEKAILSRPGSSAGRNRTRGSDSSDEEVEEGNLSAPEEGAAATPMRRPISKVGEELPDSSKSNRRPPRLEEFQHAPNLYAQNHHVPQWKGADDANGKGAELRVPAHTGVVAVAGWWVVIACPGAITITNMNSKERDRMPIYSTLDEYDLVDRDEARDVGGFNGVWTIEMKDMPIEWKVERPRVTAMEFRHGSAPGSRSTPNNSKSSIYLPSPSSTQDSERAKRRTDEGRYLWCGTRDGCLFELDVWNGGKLTDFRIGAHSGHVTGIYRLKGNRMLSIDEHGKCLVFCGNGARSGEQKWLRDANPRIQRIPHKEGFIKVLNGRIWTSSSISGSGKGANSTTGTNGTGSGDSKTSLTQSVGGSFTSLTQGQHRHPRHHKDRAHSGSEGPIIRVYDVDEDGALVMKVVSTGQNVGAVTSGTMLQCTPGLVYLGHEGGWVTIWTERGIPKDGADGKGLQPGKPSLHRHDSFTSSTSSLSQTSDDETEEGTMIDSPITFSNNGSGNAKFPPPPSALVPTVSTDGTGPVCIRKVKISISDVISLEGIGSRLWAGNRKGMIHAYDVTGGTEAGDADAKIRGEDVAENRTTDSGKEGSNEQRPWIVTNVWKAHGDLPVTELRVDPYSLDQVQRLVVYSVGRDERLCFWDGFLSQNWIDSEMLTREQSYCTFRPLKLLVLTWNVDAAKPDALVGSKNGTFLQNFLANPALEGGLPDIIVVGFQEVIDLEDKKLTAKTVLLGSTKKKTDGTISEKVSRHYRLWHDRLVAEVHRAYPAESYIVQHTENMVGLFTCVFVRRSVAHPTPSTKNIRDIAITTIKCGMYGMYGNKGAIVARFTVDDSSFCFMNCHLAAGQSQKVARNMDVAAILEEKAVFPISATDSDSHNGDFVSYVGGGDGSMVLDHELCFLNGDLNYRIDQRRDTVLSNIQSGKYTHLLQYDQLNHELLTNPSFRLHTFIEPRITFAPTYKYDRGTNEYDSSEKRRIPAWCDRILYRCRDPSRIQNNWYGRYEPDISDHRPVCGVYRVVVKKIVPEKRTKELSIVRKMWNKEQLKLCADARAYLEEIFA
ncbi:hypothetical protein CPB86DRAFT_783977 [Serendipita vermifera]|nr:hypothetical protein CPB86DRAFT_783977 [Serendipita vermifera]